VLALDVEPKMIEFLQKRAAHAGLTNVEAKVVAPADPGLAAGSVARILIVNTWHHIDERASYARKLAAALAPGGQVWVVDFTLDSDTGESVTLSSLQGSPVVLYFYPKDDTPGCTAQACGIRDAWGEFEKAGAVVLGVSPDGVASHQKFVAKYGLPFTLLSDTSRELASAYGVWALKKNYGREFMGIVRSTFLVDGEGVVRKAWRGVRVNGHVPAVQAAAAELG
jgi:peroxiredoxin Q/BCP